MTANEVAALLDWAAAVVADPACLGLNPDDRTEAAAAEALTKAASALLALAEENASLREAHDRLEKKIEALAIMGRDIVRYADQAVNYPKKHNKAE